MFLCLHYTNVLVNLSVAFVVYKKILEYHHGNYNFLQNATELLLIM